MRGACIQMVALHESLYRCKMKMPRATTSARSQRWTRYSLMPCPTPPARGPPPRARATDPTFLVRIPMTLTLPRTLCCNRTYLPESCRRPSRQCCAVPGPLRRPCGTPVLPPWECHIKTTTRYRKESSMLSQAEM